MNLDTIEKVREVLYKKPFVRVATDVSPQRQQVTMDTLGNAPTDTLLYDVVTQADFLREFYPSGHKINSGVYYPNKLKYDEKRKRYFEEKVIRCSFPFQKIITIKHLCHLCGNDIQFELPSAKESESENQLFFDFRQGWLEKNMEVRWYEAAKSAKITGDCAVVGFMSNSKLGTKVLSYLNGDTLYPHFDPLTGELVLFARAYNDLDDKSNIVTRWVEVWDDTYMYRFKQGGDISTMGRMVQRIKEAFGLSGYVEAESPKKHNFPFIPVAYYRDDAGACWSGSQDPCDKYELAVSHLCQNNMAYAFPIMYLKGDDATIEGDIYGAVKAVTMSEDGDAGFLNRPDASSSFELQMKILLQNIFMGSFAVLPPEVKAGDLPGVAIKLLYSPAVEQAMSDAQEYNPFIDKLVEIFKYGYGLETGKLTAYKNLKISGWIKPYIHQNDTEIFTNLSTGVQNGFVSAQTSSEIVTSLGYAKNSEWDRIIKERKELQEMDLLLEIRQANATNEGGGKGSDGGSVSGGRKTDKNGNYPGENNFDTMKKYV